MYWRTELSKTQGIGARLLQIAYHHFPSFTPYLHCILRSSRRQLEEVAFGDPALVTRMDTVLWTWQTIIRDPCHCSSVAYLLI